jgi:serine protease inhibitor
LTEIVNRSVILGKFIFILCNDFSLIQVIIKNLDLKTINYFIGIGILAFLNFVGTSCKKSMPQATDISKAISLPDNGAAVIQANDQFAFNFLHAGLQTDQAISNKLISPLSSYLALSMVYNGAASTTRDSIEHALSAENLSMDDLNKTCQALIHGLPSADNRVTLSIANSIWYNQNIQPIPSYLNLVQEDYLAKLSSLNFLDPQSVNIINEWVAANTNQKITKVLDNIAPSDLMYLINALYFKGSWKYAFDPSATSNNTFYTGGGNNLSTPFMQLHGGLDYFENDSLQMLQLPYGGGNFNMYVCLPNNNFSIPAFGAALNGAAFEYWKSQLSLKDIQLSLPKFTYSYSINDMQPALTLMGMGIAFSDQADFSNMYTISAKISKSIHKTYIAVDEEGTEAAAVTTIGIIETVFMPPATVVKVNHPFYYIIQEKTSGAILFIGLVNDPSQQN